MVSIQSLSSNAVGKDRRGWETPQFSMLALRDRTARPGTNCSSGTSPQPNPIAEPRPVLAKSGDTIDQSGFYAPDKTGNTLDSSMARS
jgi:hypothetical protein